MHTAVCMSVIPAVHEINALREVLWQRVANSYGNALSLFIQSTHHCGDQYFPAMLPLCPEVADFCCFCIITMIILKEVDFF